MILLIANPGSFGKECQEYLLNRLSDKVYLKFSNELGEYDNLDALSKSLKPLIGIEKNVRVVYIGGETRNVLRMYLHNFKIPTLLSAYCHQNRFQFILLGSLSQWGMIKWRAQTKIFNDSPVGAPYDEYSRTKQLCYQTIVASNNLIGYFICPASILNHKHQSGSIYVLRKILKNTFINVFFQFKGLISYCERSDVFAAICDAVVSKEIKKLIIVSKATSALELSLTRPNKAKMLITYYIGFILYYLFYWIGLKKYSQKVALLFTEVDFIAQNKNH